MKKNIIYVNFKKKKKTCFLSYMLFLGFNFLLKNTVLKQNIFTSQHIKKGHIQMILYLLYL